MRVEAPAFKDYDHVAKMAAGFHFTIDPDARWYCHDADMGVGPIKNERIAALFAGAGTGFLAGKGLSRDNMGRYWLTAPPNDVYGVEVEDVPFVIADFRVDGEAVILQTNFGESLNLQSFQYKDEPFPGIPYVEVRNGLLARLSRNVYYQLAELGTFHDSG